MAQEKTYGEWIREDRMIDCPECGWVSVPVARTRLNKDQTAELRTCECGRVLETPAYFTCSPADATRMI